MVDTNAVGESSGVDLRTQLADLLNTYGDRGFDFADKTAGAVLALLVANRDATCEAMGGTICGSKHFEGHPGPVLHERTVACQPDSFDCAPVWVFPPVAEPLDTNGEQ